jgi:hypothetical protein
MFKEERQSRLERVLHPYESVAEPHRSTHVVQNMAGSKSDLSKDSKQLLWLFFINFIFRKAIWLVKSQKKIRSRFFCFLKRTKIFNSLRLFIVAFDSCLTDSERLSCDFLSNSNPFLGQRRECLSPFSPHLSVHSLSLACMQQGLLSRSLFLFFPQTCKSEKFSGVTLVFRRVQLLLNRFGSLLRRFCFELAK